MSGPTRRIDCRGLYCPVPILRTAEAIRDMAEGEVLELLGDDPGIREDLPAWCRGTGHELLELTTRETLISGSVRKRSRKR